VNRQDAENAKIKAEKLEMWIAPHQAKAVMLITGQVC